MDGHFHDRADAGRQLAERLRHYTNRPDVIVLGLPRGGVPVAFEVAVALQAPLDVFLVRKLGVPGREELAMGAIATGDTRVLHETVVRALDISEEAIAQVSADEKRELERRERIYREGRPSPEVQGRTAIVVDDGLATGSSMRAAIAALRERDPAEIVVAVPIAPPETCEQLAEEVDELVCALTPEPFHAVGAWYDRFEAPEEDEIRGLLRRAREEVGPPAERQAERGAPP